MLKIPDLYTGKDGIYWYTNGFNYRAIVALFVGMIPCLPGFVYSCIDGTIDNAAVKIFQICWFVAAPLTLIVYLVLNRIWPLEGLGVKELLTLDDEDSVTESVIEGVESVYPDTKGSPEPKVTDAEKV
jgi:NCS1 family nucleobase:cation symporter-1